jgi:hypothetical protein
VRHLGLGTLNITKLPQVILVLQLGFAGWFGHFRPKWWRRENLALEAKFSVGVGEMGSWKGKWTQKIAKRIFTSSKNRFLNFIYI